MVEIKTVCVAKMRNAKYVKNIASETVMDARVVQGMPVSCQSEVGSVRDRIMKNNILNDVIGHKETTVESLKLTSRRRISRSSINQKLYLHKLQIPSKEILLAAGIFCLQFQHQQNAK